MAPKFLRAPGANIGAPTPAASSSSSAVRGTSTSLNTISAIAQRINATIQQASVNCSPHAQALAAIHTRLSTMARDDLPDLKEGIEKGQGQVKCPLCPVMLNSNRPSDSNPHIRQCAVAKVKQDVQAGYEAHAKKTGCPVRGCSFKGRAAGTRNDIAVHATKEHTNWKTVCGCEVVGSKTACTFSVPSESAVDAVVLAIHREIAHGYLVPPTEAYYYDSVTGEWVFGYGAIQLHCASRLPSPGETLNTVAEVSNKQCPLCLFDESLTPIERYREWTVGARNNHFWRMHIFTPSDTYTEASQTFRCPHCAKDVIVWLLIDHLALFEPDMKKKGSTALGYCEGLRPPSLDALKKRFNTWSLWAGPARTQWLASQASTPASAPAKTKMSAAAQTSAPAAASKASAPRRAASQLPGRASPPVPAQAGSTRPAPRRGALQLPATGSTSAAAPQPPPSPSPAPHEAASPTTRPATAVSQEAEEDVEMGDAESVYRPDPETCAKWSLENQEWWLGLVAKIDFGRLKKAVSESRNVGDATQ